MVRISVIIPVRNGAATLYDALSSILASPSVGEVVVIDDGSTDGSAEIALTLGDTRIRVIEGPCTGISGALNVGFRAVRFDYVLRCDADDQIVTDSLEFRLAHLEADLDCVAVSGGYFSMTAKGRHIADLAANAEPRDVTEMLRAGQTITHFGTWLTRRAALIAVGGARDWFVTAEDLDLQFRLAERGTVWHDPRICYMYRLHESSITHRQSRTLREFYEANARAFAVQRRGGGQDDLEAGHPPEPDTDSARPDAPTSAREQAAGHLEAAAWAHQAKGIRREAIQLLIRSISLTPFRMGRWKGLAAMVLGRGG